MIENHRYVERFDIACEIVDPGYVGQELQMPTEMPNPVCQRLGYGKTGLGREHWIDAHAAYALFMQTNKLAFWQSGIDDGNTAHRHPRFGHGGKNPAVVGAVHARLNRYSARKAEQACQMFILGQARVGRSVPTGRIEGIVLERAEDVEMRVDRADR
jgi:hypothetical protein